ncbi:MAG TPA: metallopeptidase family protein [Candidatus Acidoferrales bacterium]|nr:metallopeptidase family protein [Candidatus Acidoferrales bacterium]
MDKEKFEMLVEKAFEELPQEFKSRIENVHVVVEDLPDDVDLSGARVKNKYSLLGLYAGIPLKKRGADYGVYPVIPDRIKLFKENIERISSNDDEVELKIREVLVHEVAHYFGMTDQEIRKAGY